YEEHCGADFTNTMSAVDAQRCEDETDRLNRQIYAYNDWVRACRDHDEKRQQDANRGEQERLSKTRPDTALTAPSDDGSSDLPARINSAKKSARDYEVKTKQQLDAARQQHEEAVRASQWKSETERAEQKANDSVNRIEQQGQEMIGEEADRVGAIAEARRQEQIRRAQEEARRRAAALAAQ